MLALDDSDFLRRILDSRAEDIWTTFSARIESYYSSSRTADLQPVIRRPLGFGESESVFEPLPILPNVPIRFPMGGGGTYAITWPLEVGDFVDVHVTTYSQAQWRRTGTMGLSGDTRPHNLSSCYATPGACPNSQALEQAEQMALVIEAPEIKLGKSATEFVALASKVLTELNKIKSAMTDAVIVPNDGGASLKSTFLAALNFTLPGSAKVKSE